MNQLSLVLLQLLVVLLLLRRLVLETVFSDHMEI